MVKSFVESFNSRIADFISLSILIATVISISILYISSEHTFRFWDFLLYENLTFGLFDTVQKSLLLGIQSVFQSLTNDYNQIFCIPILPWLFLLGKTRLAFIIGLNVSYLVPFSLSVGRLATAVLAGEPELASRNSERWQFWLAAFLSLAIPSVWLPSIFGYPDIGGMSLIACAIILYLKDFYLRKGHQILLISICLASAFLFRRHLVYNAFAFLLTIGIQSSFLIVSLRKIHTANYLWRQYFSLLGRAIAIPIISFMIVASVAPGLVQRIATHNYRHLYTSYELAVTEGLRSYTSSYGVTILIIAISGLGIGYQRRILDRSATRFMSVYGVLVYIVWLFGARYGGVPLHYNLHFTLPVVLGVTAFFWVMNNSLHRRVRQIAFGISLLILALNGAIALIPTPISTLSPHRPFFVSSYRPMDVAGEGYFPISLLSASIPPDRRSDYDEVSRLVNYLHSLVPNRELIYVASSSVMLNESVLVEAEHQRYGIENSRFALAPIAIVDSRDFYPLNSLMVAQYVVVATPFQHSLAAQEQDVVKVVMDAFVESWAFADDFEQLPKEFSLQKNVKVHVYRRIRPTSVETALTTLEQMKTRIGEVPGADPYWLALQAKRVPLRPRSDMTGYDFVPQLDRDGVTDSFVYYGQISEKMAIQGSVRSPAACSQVTMSVSALPAQKKLTVQTVKIMPERSNEFSITVSAQGATYLRLDVMVQEDRSTSRAASKCAISRDLRSAIEIDSLGVAQVR